MTWTGNVTPKQVIRYSATQIYSYNYIFMSCFRFLNKNPFNKQMRMRKSEAEVGTTMYAYNIALICSRYTHIALMAITLCLVAHRQCMRAERHCFNTDIRSAMTEESFWRCYNLICARWWILLKENSYKMLVHTIILILIWVGCGHTHALGTHHRDFIARCTRAHAFAVDYFVSFSQKHYCCVITYLWEYCRTTEWFAYSAADAPHAFAEVLR